MSGCFTATWDSSHDLVSMEETVGPGSSRVSQREQGKGQPSDQGTSERESEAQRYGDMAHSGADALEKKDEPGLMGRMSDQSDSSEQRQRILDTVQRLKSQGVSRSCVLNGLGIPRSTFHFWRSEKDRKTRLTAYNALLEYERQSIVSIKQRKTHLSHRQIIGLLRHQNVWVSSSTCYRELKSRGMLWTWTLRESPWKTAHYEPYEPNRIWG